MKFNKMIALVAIVGLAAQSNAYAGGPLRRVQTTQVAQNEVDPAAQPQVIVIPSNGGQTTTIQTQAAAAPATTVSAAQAPVVVQQAPAPAPAPVVQQQPVTVVEAAPAAESKAEGLRKARQDAEVQTEQKIVEKLEESRLKEEQQRAERLFGDKFEAQAPAASVNAAAPVTPPPAAAPALAPAPAVVTPAAPVAEQKPATQVTIEKLEIVQPPVVDSSAKAADNADAKSEAAPAGESQLKVSDEDQEKPAEPKYYVGGLLAAPEYNASNVKTNYGLGVTVGTLIDDHNAIELSFLYSSYLIDTFWTYGLYKELTQYDVQLAYKYYIMTGQLKPYVGASASYINRSYQDRVKSGMYYAYNQTSDSENTNAVDVGLLAGVDYQISPRIVLGAGLDYNHNVMNSRADFTSIYRLQADDTKALEEIDYYTFKITAKMSF